MALRRPDDNTPEWSPPVVTWDDLIAREPRLEGLERDIKYHATQHRTGSSYCANRFWYGYMGLGFKDRLCQLVGWEAHRTRLQSSEAYDVSYDHLYSLLPDCRHERGICA